MTCSNCGRPMVKIAEGWADRETGRRAVSYRCPFCSTVEKVIE